MSENELSGYEAALRSVLDSYNALSFTAHRKLADVSGRQPGGLPALYGEVQTELRRIQAARQAQDIPPEPEPQPPNNRAAFALAVTEPFADYARGNIISDPAEMAHAQKEHPGKTIRITLK